MSSTRRRWKSVVALSGGVGGARFAYGLEKALPPGTLTVIVNTGDDFRHWGLEICPDVDTNLYTLSGLSDDERGWGLAGETFHALESMKRLHGESWFMLGDRDLATHLQRTEALARGDRLTEITERFRRALSIDARILPMADGPCRTMIDTETHGTLPFQEWFVRERAAPAVRRVWMEGDPAPSPEVLRAIAEAELIVIGPSNPYVSIDPIVSRPGVREALARRPVIAVSPIVAGRAVKGPLAEMLLSLTGHAASAAAVARHYGGLLRGFVVQRGDEADIEGVIVQGCETVMRTRAERTALAREVLAFAERFVPAKV